MNTKESENVGPRAKPPPGGRKRRDRGSGSIRKRRGFLFIRYMAWDPKLRSAGESRSEHR